MEVRPSSSRVRVIWEEDASREFSISSFRVEGMSRMSWPLEILRTVVESSLLIIL